MDFTMRQNLKKLKLTFLAEKSTNIVLEYTKRCGIAIFFFGGGMFSMKSSFCLYFHEEIMILDFWDYNWAPSSWGILCLFFLWSFKSWSDLVFEIHSSQVRDSLCLSTMCFLRHSLSSKMSSHSSHLVFGFKEVGGWWTRCS